MLFPWERTSSPPLNVCAFPLRTGSCFLVPVAHFWVGAPLGFVLTVKAEVDRLQTLIGSENHHSAAASPTGCAQSKGSSTLFQQLGLCSGRFFALPAPSLLPGR